MRKLLIITEEESAKKFLDTYLPRYISEKHNGWTRGRDYIVHTVSFKGKGELLKKLRKVIPNSGYDGLLILMDQDEDDCKQAKNKLKIALGNCKYPVKFRIACHELETFYLGDLDSLEKSLKKRISTGRKSPDSITNPSRHIGGYCNYSKTELAIRMGNRISHHTTSVSFQMLQNAVDELLSC